LKDLELTSKQPLIPEEELDRLSRLALINIESSDREMLRQDLANMLHMVDQVSSYPLEDDDEDEDAIYDGVRGVTAAPLRKTAEQDPLQQVDQEQAGKVWKSLLQPKTTRKGGGHEYFSIQTKQGES
jgi:Asp-tRNA(Asn)/Glu-tRNA(Gln) amidotransferase C subunit